jgi:hypothetical protein
MIKFPRSSHSQSPAISKKDIPGRTRSTVASSGVRARLVVLDSNTQHQLTELIETYNIALEQWERSVQKLIDRVYSDIEYCKGDEKQ